VARLAGVLSLQIAELLVEYLLDRFTPRIKSSKISASIGVVVYPKDAESADTLLKRADAAMFFSKRHEKTNLGFTQQSQCIYQLLFQALCIL